MVSQEVSVLIAFAAGAVSFLSPCILPVIPSYLSFLGGVAFGDLGDAKVSRRQILLKTIFFVAGFSVVFVALGVAFSSAGLMLKGVQPLVDRIAGAVVVFFGLNVAFDFWRFLNIERRLHLKRRPQGALGSVLLGLAFGAGWTPCVGPILASILFLAGTVDSLDRGVLLLAAYSLGLGAPFVLAGAFFDRFLGYSRRLRSHMRAIKIASSVFLVLLGGLIFFGGLSRLNIQLFGLAGQLETWETRDPAGPRLLFGLLFLGLSGIIALLRARRAARSLSPGPSLARAFRPFSALMILALLAASVLSFFGTLNIGAAISSWLRFQGL